MPVMEQDRRLDAASPAMSPVESRLGVALRMLAEAGYGAWMLHGMALAFGVFRAGRGESLVPLALGAVFVSTGLVVACSRRSAAPSWHGWRPRYSSWPTAAALMAFATYLPMLAVAGLTRGDNLFWATRASGALLAACSLVTLVIGCNTRSPHAANRAALPVERVLFAWYAGGLWLWVCAAADDRIAQGLTAQPWTLLLLVLALLLGLIESMRWRALRQTGGRAGVASSARWLAALLSFGGPCVALVLSDAVGRSAALAVAAACACLAGKLLEQRLYALRSAPAMA